ncbi:MAG: CBS domain-containing protein, partial [Gemmataceae bacterium]
MPKALTVRDIMLRSIFSAQPESPIRDVLAIMNQYRIGSVPVLSGEKIIGIFTERDLLRRVVGAVPGWREYPIADWMTPNPHTINPDLGWEEAVDLMHQLKVRHLPVVENDRLVGMISTRLLMTQRTAHLDARIDERTVELRQANDQLLAKDSEASYYLKTAGRLQQNLL